MAKILNPTGAATGAGAATGGLLAAMQQSAAGFKQGIASMGAAATAQYEALTEQAEAALAALEAQYCKPATFTPSECGGRWAGRRGNAYWGQLCTRHACLPHTYQPAPFPPLPLLYPSPCLAGEKVPATFVGHSMAITFDMGSCTFDDHKWLHGGEKVRGGWGGGVGGGA